MSGLKTHRIAVVCASGIGDALLMQISAAHLHKLGIETVTFSKHLQQLGSWFPSFSFSSCKSLETLSTFDAILLQYDNTDQAKSIRAMNKTVHTLYGDYQFAKHGPLRTGLDAIFDPSLPMAQNIAKATFELFPGTPLSLYNGLLPPENLLFRKYMRRIAIHPTSTAPAKNWEKSSFVRLKEKLVKDGWDPVFILPPHEADHWGSPKFPSLKDLAEFLYESGFMIGNDSGPGHLASNLGIPTLTIGPSKHHLNYWRPGWAAGKIVHPPDWIHKFRLFRNNWKKFVSVNKVLRIFYKLKYES